MAFTYSGNPLNSDAEHVRFLIGDTDRDNPLYTDEEIQYLVITAGDVLGAAVRAVEGVLAKLSGAIDESVGSVSISFSNQRTGYEKLYDRLMARLAIEGAVPYCGGISIADKQARLTDANREPTQFSVRMFNTPNTTQSSRRAEVRGSDRLTEEEQ